MAPTETSWVQDIAVVGMSCRFPDEADSVQNFWDFICKGRSAYSENPERWNPDAFCFPGKKANASLPRGAHFLKQDIAAFDANFFNISKVEAESMDPQQRMAMETVYEAMENAGLPVSKLAGTQTGVWMGNFTSDYREQVFRDSESAPMYTATGTSSTSVSNRVSWFFDFKGPSFTLDTACSSTMVAMHLAVQSLSIGESSAAVVGGTNLLLNPDMFMYLSNQHFLAKDGKSKAFDESADGYGRGEGASVVVLKRMADALANGDPIRAVIRSTAINQDGHTKGLTLPSPDAQAALINEVYHKANLSMEETRYIEAHGTGTQAGDKCETEALFRTICKYRTTSEPLLVGSVKANVGHLEACAGMAAFIKCVAILETGMIPPTPSCKTPNPEVKWNEWKLKVPTTLTRWPTQGLRRVSTQGFGYGGTNGHIVMDDAYHYLEARSLRGVHNTKLLGSLQSAISNSAKDWNSSPSNPRGQPLIFCLSAQDKEGLKRLRTVLADHLSAKADEFQGIWENADNYLRDFAYTLSKRRSRLQWQTYAIASTIDGLSQSLREQPWSLPEVRSATQVPRLGFIFTGQGAQWARMGVELMEYEVFRQSFEESDRYLRQELDCPWSAVEELARPDDSSKLGQAAYSQALCSVLQIALVDLLDSWNISPSAVAGHSSGEIAAAYCLGALSRQDALKAAYFRGVLSAEMKEIDTSMRGAMMAVGATPVAAAKWLEKLTKGTVVVACVNSPTTITVSGDAAGVDELEVQLKEAGVFARKLKVDTAYHSPHMQMIAAQYFEAIADISTMSARGGCRMSSSVHGCAISSDELGPVNWVQNLTSTVQFADAVHDMIRPLIDEKRSTDNAIDILVEVGPHSALQGPASQTMKTFGISGVQYSSVLSRGKHGVTTSLSCAGALFAEGVPVDISNVNQDASDLRAKVLIDLPAYPWNHSIKYWAESRVGREYRLRKHPHLPLLGAPCPTMDVRERLWRGYVRVSQEPWVRDHVIQGSIIYPAAGFLAMAIEGARQEADSDREISGFCMRDIKIDAALVIEEDTEPEVILAIRPHLTSTLDSGSSWMEFTVSSCTDGNDLRQNCSGLLMVEYASATGSAMSLERDTEIAAIQDDFLALKKRSLGLQYGPTFANITEIQTAENETRCVSTLTIPEIESTIPASRQNRPHIIHPSTLDAIFHLAFAAIHNEPDAFSGAMVPTQIDEIMVRADIAHTPGTVLHGYAHSAQHGLRDMLTNIEMLDRASSKPMVRVKGFRCSDISGASAQSDDGHGATGVVKPITCEVSWKPAIEILSLEELQAVVDGQPEDIAAKEPSLDQAVLTLLKEVLTNVPRGRVSTPFQSFYDWIQNHVSSSRLQSEPVGRGSDSAFRLIGENLSGILQGQVIASKMLWNDSTLFGRLLSETAGFEEILRKLNEYLSLVHHSNPGLSILEIDLGGGELPPVSLVSKLKDAAKFLETGQYTLSGGHESLQAAADQFGSLKSRVHIDVQDIGKLETTASQQKFDFVLLFNTKLATSSPGPIVANAVKLLKETGRICIVDIDQPQLQLGTILGSIQGDRWLDKACQPWLERAGLTNHFALEDSQKQFRLTVAAAQAPSPAISIPAKEIFLVEACEPSPAAQEVASQICRELEKLSIRTIPFRWGSDVAQLHSKSCIVLTDLEKALLQDVSSADFHAAQQMILQAEGLLWVSGALGPDSHLISGLARSVRNEVAGIKFRTLQVNGTPLEFSHEFASMILRVLQSSLADDEFISDGGIIKVSRMLEDRRRNEILATMLGKRDSTAEMMPLDATPGPVKLGISNPGMLDSLWFEPDTSPEIPLAPDEIEVQVKASGVNFRDVMVAMGQIPDKLFGFEAAGLVRRVGENVTNVEIGDRVAFLGHGAHRTIYRVRAQYAMPIPDTMCFEEAAGVLLVHGTAWYALMEIAKAQKGQSVLIHAAAGGVGQAAIMLAQHLGLEIFATVGSGDKKKLIQDHYGIPNDHIFNSRDLSFVKGVKRMTSGRGVDVILNSLSGEALRQSWYCIAPFGTFVEIGMKDILGNMRLDMRPFLQDAKFVFFNLNRVMKERPELMNEILSGAMALLSSGATHPVQPLTVYPISQMEDAFRLMQAGKHRGKLVLTYSASDVVPVVSSAPRAVQLDEIGSYILVGGLGGLGRSLCQHFVRMGARKLCVLSRSGTASIDAQRVIENLQQEGVQVLVIRCDVSDPKSTADAIAKCATELGPVRGVVQGAMVLRDALFEKMNYDEWKESTRPKVQGSWNLHTNLPDVDFFLTLSSFAGVFGNHGQSNYAAAGAYEDALAQYRRSQGLKAVTLDLGIMRDVGVLAETGLTDNLREWAEPCGIREAEFHALVENVLAGELDNPGHTPAQIPTGFATGRTVQDTGISRPWYFDDSRFSILALTGSQVAQAASIAEASAAVMDALVARVAKSLQSAVSDIDTSRPLHAFGVDSLVAVEVANWVFREIKTRVTVFEILSSVPISTLAEKIALKSSLLPQMASNE
ncbi:hypothetical protein N7509_003052 [Penicillium cosmopolitanum]|uniref:Carrier domain-containing protein n=1 Tax=Penicillium cosmopolitanum TaxID=1131564 RepID=A0A9X0BAZ7_9EURO|nr:uncharacterized protein N7509_003052 [Penicillium cosmopolitanum]KAJ5403181.1 hypothetical protein N7509_003052 [Penicillium cosmopolitanum]